ncbi:zinc-binding dehydrogenase [Novosphingobium sp. JCM 18896]|uniref:zinc-binding dehydrogenase n=1 Tax=Novosphingobium sp. JCM 18896 TaxID=2989731 RepID=UPI002222C3A2|nr:zinc-binding dehydrogenase [Novosphingobium sp. JCM 18896]MCW1430944.1 zinc-binding dehydrogenase [Novosphingobium sp. JCM 18896]
MNDNSPDHGLQLTSTLEADGTLRLVLAEVSVDAPAADEVLVRLEAVPINPSDLMPLLAGADPAAAHFGGSTAGPEVTITLSPEAAQAYAGRMGAALQPGLAGAGTVIAAGAEASHLLGQRVTLLSLRRGTFGQYVTVSTAECAALPESVSAREGADAFCNPMTALAIAETVRLDGHKALVHTAAASNLGQMLVRICAEDGIPLVNVVRRAEQAQLLRELGAEHVCNSADPDFAEHLRAAIAATGATVAFDAIGGGTSPGLLLAAMEEVAAAQMGFYSPYGSLTLKQVNIYGHLDRSPTVLHNARYGMLWDVRNWALPRTLGQLPPERIAAMNARVLAGLKTTFASHFTREISLAQVLDRETMTAYAKLATGEKFVINPTL